MKTTKNTSIDKWLDELGTENVPSKDTSRLRAIGDALTELERAQENLDRAVQAAKDAGDSWAAIGVVLGTSRQAAHRKYAQVVGLGKGTSVVMHKSNAFGRSRKI